MDKNARRYLKRLRSFLTCPKEDRAKLLEQAAQTVERYSQENPNALYSTYVAALGSPAGFARELLTNVKTETIVRFQRRRKWVAYAVVAIVVIVSVAFSVLDSSYWNQQCKEAEEESAKFTVIIQPVKYLTDEEAEQFWKAHPENDTYWSIDMENKNGGKTP